MGEGDQRKIGRRKSCKNPTFSTKLTLPLEPLASSFLEASRTFISMCGACASLLPYECNLSPIHKATSQYRKQNDALFIAVTPYLPVAGKSHLPTGSFLGPILRLQLHAMFEGDPILPGVLCSILPGVFDIPTKRESQLLLSSYYTMTSGDSNKGEMGVS